jgi:two-component system NtrC family response regulator/two-component system response regulator AtoC
MEQRMRSGAFRSDLYYRLEVLAFLVPPLRERRADLPAVLDAVLVDLGERFGRPGAVLAPTARAWMLQHPWPGNLRQLRNVLERGLILSGEGPIDPPQPKNISEEVPLTLLAVEQAHILHALAYTRGNQSRAAKLLGISRKALWEKRKRYGMK